MVNIIGIGILRKKPKKPILQRARAWLDRRVATGKAINDFSKGSYRLGVQMLLNAGHSAIAKKMVENEIKRLTNKMAKAQIELEYLGEIPNWRPLPDRRGTYYAADWNKLLTIEKAEKLQQLLGELRTDLKELMQLQKELE